MKAKIVVSRGTEEKPGSDEFLVDVKEGETVLDILRKIKDQFDGSLTFRYSCRSGICGSCAVHINGTGKLACKTQALPEVKKYGLLKIEPLRSATVVKDLVVDFEGFFNVLEKLETWIDPAQENIKISAEEIKPVDESAGCILCGICTFNCETYCFEQKFAGPAAMAQTYKVIADPRGRERKKRLKKAIEHGLWWCSRSYYCSELCPKDVKPGEKIFNLRGMCLDEDLKCTSGAKRVIEFLDSVEHHGRLNETLLPLKAKGLGSITLFPVGLRLLSKGKVPSLIMKDINGLEEVKHIMEKKEK